MPLHWIQLLWHILFWVSASSLAPWFMCSWPESSADKKQVSWLPWSFLHNEKCITDQGASKTSGGKECVVLAPPICKLFSAGIFFVTSPSWSLYVSGSQLF